MRKIERYEVAGWVGILLALAGVLWILSRPMGPDWLMDFIWPSTHAENRGMGGANGGRCACGTANQPFAGRNFVSPDPNLVGRNIGDQVSFSNSAGGSFTGNSGSNGPGSTGPSAGNGGQAANAGF